MIIPENRGEKGPPTKEPSPLATAGGAGAPPAAALRVVHVTTVPQTLMFLGGQAGYLRARGIEVLAVSSPGEALDVFAAAEGVRCFAVPMERAIVPLRDAVALLRLSLLLRRLRPDIVDSHTPKAGLLGMAAAWLAGVPVRVYHLHGLRFETARGARRSILRLADRLSASLATRVLCVSASLARAAAQEELAPAAKLGVLGPGSINGADAERFHPPTDEERRASRAALGIPADARVVGFVGRLVREKGLVELFGAWRVLRAELPDAWLVLVGPGEPHDPLPKEVVAGFAADPRVRNCGLDWDTPKYFRAMDVVALPTHREGFGVVALEAAATGLAVVATRVTGCVDAVADGATGTLVEAADTGALLAALRAYLVDPELRRRHGAAGRERAVHEFSRERIWAALHAEYVSLAGEHGSRRAVGQRRSAERIA